MLGQKTKKFLSALCIASILTTSIYASTDISTLATSNSNKQEVGQTAQNSAQSQKEMATQDAYIDQNYKNFKLIAAGLSVLSIITISLCIYTIISNKNTANSNESTIKDIKKLYKNQVLKLDNICNATIAEFCKVKATIAEFCKILEALRKKQLQNSARP